MKTSRCLVSTLLKLSTKLQDRHYALEGRNLPVHFFTQLIMAIDWNPSTIIFNRH